MLSENSALEWSKEAAKPDYFKANEEEVIRQYMEMVVELSERVTTYTYKDEDMNNIIYEYIYEYFQGKISAEETAQILQRKISMVMEG